MYLGFGISSFITQIAITIVMALSNNLLASYGAQPIIGFNYGAKNFHRVRKAFDIALVASEVVAIVGFLIFQFAPMSVVSLFGSEEGLYNEFAVLSFRIFLLFCPLTGFQTVAAIYL